MQHKKKECLRLSKLGNFINTDAVKAKTGPLLKAANSSSMDINKRTLGLRCLHNNACKGSKAISLSTFEVATVLSRAVHRNTGTYHNVRKTSKCP